MDSWHQASRVGGARRICGARVGALVRGADRGWEIRCAREMHLDPAVAKPLRRLVLEVRSGFAALDQGARTGLDPPTPGRYRSAGVRAASSSGAGGGEPRLAAPGGRLEVLKKRPATDA